MSSIAVRRAVTAVLTAAVMLGQLPSVLLPSQLPATAIAAPVIDQEQPTAESSVVVDAVADGQQLAQTAVVGISGRVVRFEVPIFCPDNATLQFSVRHSALDGSPGGNSIVGVASSGTVVKGTPENWWGFTFNTPRAESYVRAGDRITLHARVTFGGPCSWYHGPNGDPYAGGRSWSRPHNLATWQPLSETKNDLPFRTFIEPGLPDLTPANLTYSGILQPGNSVTYGWSVTNAADIDSPTSPMWGDQLWISPTPTLGAGRVAAGGIVSPNALGARGSYTQSFTATFPTVPDGSYYLILQTDSNSDIVEANEGNNTVAIPITVGPALPDLVVTAVTAPSSVVSGGTIDYGWTVKNQGTATAVAITTSPPGPPYQWHDQAWISPSATSIAGAYPAGGILTPGSLAPNASYDRSFGATIGAIPPGSYFFIIETDSNAKIAETVETNNLSAGVPITVTAPSGATVSAQVREDLDRDGVQDATEPLLTVPKLEVFRVNGDGSRTLVGSAVTSPNLTVSGIEPGTFVIVETDPSGYVSTSPNSVTVTVAAGGSASHVFLDTAVLARFAYVYKTDTSARDKWSEFLNSRGYAVDALTETAAETASFSPYRAILIANDTGDGDPRVDPWGTATAVANITGSGKPIVALGDGGSKFLDAKAGGVSKIGWLQSWIVTAANGVIVVDGADAAWTTPNATGLATGATATLYGSSVTTIAVHAPAATTGVTRIGRQTDDADHYPVIREGCDVHWGFTASASSLTATGKAVFENLIAPCGAGPRILDARVSVSGGVASRSDAGDEVALTFDKAIDATLTDNVIRVADRDGGVYDIACNGTLVTGNGLVDASCTWDSARLVLTIRMLGDSAGESGAAHGTGPVGLHWPGTIVSTTGISDLAGAAVDLPGSADLLIDLPGVRGIAEFRTVTNGVESAIPLGGATVTVTGGPTPIAPVTAGPTGAFELTGLAANTDYTFTYAATLPTSFGSRLYQSRATGRTDAAGALNVPRPPVYPDNKNHTWVSAATAQSGTVYAEQIRKSFGSIWYRIPIAPQQQVQISVTGLDAPYTLTAYRDLRKIARALVAASTSNDIGVVQEVLTGGMSADGIDSDGIDSDGIDSDGIDSDGIDSDGIDSDGIDSDGIDSDGIDSDGIDSDGIDSDGIDSDGIDSNGDGDTGYGPVYETVQDRGLRAASLNPGLADETIVLNTRNLTGELYVRVRATETFDPFGTFNVQITRVDPASCVGADFSAVAPTTLATSLPTGKRTLILTNTAALGLGSNPTPQPAEATLALPLTATSTALTLVEPIPGGWGHVGWVKVGNEVMHFTGYDALTRTLAIDRRGDQGTTAAIHLTGAAVQRWTLTKSAYLALLGTLAARTEIAGHVVDLADDAGYASVHARWRALPACAALANVVTDTVNAVVSRFAAQNPLLEYLVFAAGDHGIPYRRVPDVAEIARESRYNPPVGPTTSSEASLIGDWILTDDFYGGQAVPRFERDLYLSKYAIGRLVERVEDQAAYIAMYAGTGGVLRPQSGVSAGYDFNADAAREIEKSLAGTTHGVTRLAMDSLITDATSAAQWSAADLRALLFGAKKYDVLSLFGHYQANRLVPADNGPRVDSREIAVSTLAKFYRSLVFTIGCHSGYNIPDPDATFGTQPLAFPEAFLGQGATFVGGTGYQYGDTEAILYTELLLHMLSLELGYSNDRDGTAWGQDGVPIGAALRNAKALYANSVDPQLELTGLAEKSVLVSTLYGLPHLRFALPNPVLRPAPQPVATTSVNGVLSTYTTSFVNPALATPATGDTLFSLNPHAGVNGGTYYDGGTPFDVSAAPFRPISPARDRDIESTRAEIVRGSVFLGGTYVQSPFTPTLSVPVTEDAGPAPAYVTPNFLPVRPFSVNDLGGQRLIGLPFQYRSDGGTSGTARVYSTVRTRVYYSGATGLAALVGAPEIRSVELTRPNANTNILRLRVLVAAHGDPGNALITDPSLHLPGIAEVLATYTADSGPLHGTWASAPMTAGATTRIGPDQFLREYTYDLDVQTADLGAAQFMVQAVGSYGNVEVASRDGAYYRFAAAATVPPSQPAPAATALTLSATPTAVVYRQAVQLTATLRDTAGQPLSGKTVTLALDGKKRDVTTGVDGTATTTYVAALAPRTGAYHATATFLGDATHGPSATALAPGVTVSRAPSSFVTTPVTLTYSSAGTIAQLRSGTDVLAEEPVTLTLGGVQTGTITDSDGRVRFETLDFGGVAPGTHTVGLRYAGGRSYDAARDATVQVTVLPDEATVALTEMGPQAVGAITFYATVAEVADAAPGDIRRGTVEWTFTTESGVTTTATSPVAADGTSSVTVTLGAGVYRVGARAGASYTSDIVAFTMPVYDPSVYVTGGGWVPTGPTPTGVSANARANFGFVAKYLEDNVTPTGNLLVHVRSAKGKDNDTDAQAAANGSFIFRSTSYTWLVISGNGAAFTGTGKVNGTTGYSFRADVVDATTDEFVLHVWDANGSYEQPTHVVRGALGGGQIKIQR